MVEDFGVEELYSVNEFWKGSFGVKRYDIKDFRVISFEVEE